MHLRVIAEVEHFQQGGLNVESRNQFSDRPNLEQPVPADFLGLLWNVGGEQAGHSSIMLYS